MISLIECYLPVFQHGVALHLHTDHFTSYDDYRVESLRLLAEGEATSLKINHREEITIAHFAIVAWLDELVLRANPIWEGEWRNHLLQHELFNTTIGGEIFFRNLEAIDTENIELRKFHLFCLALGFKGEFVYRDQDLNDFIQKEKNKLPNETTIQLLTGSSETGKVSRQGLQAARSKRNKIIFFTLVFILSLLMSLGVLDGA
ncbi:DotU family type IV/VI secretion system protein [Citrobacter arsenatis]|uniref:DotU family type IV/VI secretion system protein n=1 Tax=Citrobacter arsenatis TaxID=2546350 RepID=UPI00300E354E